MIALDTNVVVRLLTADDRHQLRVAREAIQGQRLWLAKSVLLESEWVLRYTYELDRATVHAALSGLIHLEGLTVEDRPAVTSALAAHAAGVDFADALHLASSAGARRFLTFDRRLAARADDLALERPVDLLNAADLNP